MTKLQKIMVRQSEVRERLGEIAAVEELTDELKAEERTLSTELRDLEVKYRAAVAAEGKPDDNNGQAPVIDAETRALDRLVGRASIGGILQATLDQRSTDGAEAELQQHFGLSGNQIAVEQLETRAVTPAPADVGQSQHPIIPQIFPAGVASFLGVGMPTVPVGEQTYTVLTTGATVHTPAENADADETTGAFSASVLSPKRAQASFFWSIEDQARLSGMEAALRQNLRQALSSKFDQILVRNTDDGLLGGGLTAPGDPSNVVNFGGYKKAITDQVDGTYASMPDQVVLLIGSETYSHAEGLYRTNNQGNNESAFEVMSRKSGGVRVSSHVPAKASDIQGALAARRLNAMHAVMPIWRGITLIPDNVTKAKSGQVVLTAVALWSLKVLRADGFSRLKFKLA